MFKIVIKHFSVLQVSKKCLIKSMENAAFLSLEVKILLNDINRYSLNFSAFGPISDGAPQRKGCYSDPHCWGLLISLNFHHLTSRALPLNRNLLPPTMQKIMR